jgi:hypothetical protein
MAGPFLVATQPIVRRLHPSRQWESEPKTSGSERASGLALEGADFDVTGHVENILPGQTQDFLFAQSRQPGQGKDRQEAAVVGFRFFSLLKSR